MNNPMTLLAAVLMLAAGTFAFRFAGPLLRDRIEVPERIEKLLAAAAVVLLTAVVATAALTQSGSHAGIARPAGVLVAGILVWRRAPFVLVVAAAAGTAALLRWLGVP